MNDKEFRELHYQYCKNQESITRKGLYALIDYLHSELDDTEKQLREAYNENDRDNEPHNYKEDLD
jgi:hypothetical protein